MRPIQNLIHSFRFYKKSLVVEVFLFCICVAVVFFIHLNFKIKKANQEVCQILYDNYIDSISTDVLQECLGFAEQNTYWYQSNFIAEMNLWLRSFNISHLHIYNTYENQKMWKGISYETGIIAKKIFGQWRVTEIFDPKSTVKVGDTLLKINQKKITNANQILTQEGRYLVKREGKKLSLRVELKKITYDQDMSVKNINEDWDYLKVPSFRSDYFTYENLESKLTKFKGSSLILDLRNNLGGNFVSTLRLLSALMCETKQVGKIFNYRSPQDSGHILENDLDDLAQIRSVTDYNPIYLKTFSSPICHKPQNLIVIMNEKTASVSELLVLILEQNFKHFKSYGTTTAGQMLLAIWYPVDSLGNNVLMSVPYAWATGQQEQIVEGLGVDPSETLSNKDLLVFKTSLDPLLQYILTKIGA